MNRIKEIILVRYVSVFHYVMWNILKKRLNNVLVAEFPKSGGSWFCKMLADATGLPQPSNYELPKIQTSILHGVFFNEKKLGKTICIVRDGRDVMVSAYFFFLFKNDKNIGFSIDKRRKQMPFDDYDNVEKNLPAFIEYMFNDYTVRNKKMNWVNFNDSFINQENVKMIKYENLLTQCKEEMIGALDFLEFPEKSEKELNEIIEKYSFEKMAKRKRGEENNRSFMRKGIAGDWKNKFSKEACVVFDKYAGDMLIKLGYETDHNWY